MLATLANGVRCRLVAASVEARVALHTSRVNDAPKTKAQRLS